MTINHPQSWTSRASSSKRLTPGRRPAMVLAAIAGVLACALAAGCGRDGDRVERAQAADSTPMLPGTRGALSPAQASGGGKAQGFDTVGGSPEAGASGALLPPVMHSAD